MANNTLQAVRGMNDVLPEDALYWQQLEDCCRQVAKQFCYQEIRLPILEATALFKRTIGEVTDIVEKEMYTFEDRNGESVTMRPEGTAGCVRAGIEHSLFYGDTPRLWYLGPMFRHERPQKGRYRQFYQLGAEAFGMASPAADVEIILLTHQLWEQLELSEQLCLQINTLGTTETRKAYREQLVAYFEAHQDQLDDDSKRRLHANPLRILDSKNPAMQSLIEQAPKLLDALDDVSRQHFDQVKTLLDQAGVPYEVNPRLVRGLDYYCHTVFEWVTDSLGAQGTVCAGGRYDGLVEQLGGQATPAVGFSAGLERIILLLKEQQEHAFSPDVYCVLMGDQAMAAGLVIAKQLRQRVPGLKVETNLTGAGFKSQFKKADKSRAKYALVIGDNELATGQYALKNLQDGEQQALTLDAIVALLST